MVIGRPNGAPRRTNDYTRKNRGLKGDADGGTPKQRASVLHYDGSYSCCSFSASITLSSNKDKKDDTAAVDFGAAYINDGAAYISGLKAENPKKIAVAYRIAFTASGDGLYYIDNYAKLKYYDIASGDSKDVFINVADFQVYPSADIIAVVEKGESGHLKIVSAAGDEVADLGTGTRPSWFAEGQRLAYISGTAIYDAAGGDWNAYPLYEGNPLDIAVSPDGTSILFCEYDAGKSRLALLTIATKAVTEIKSASLHRNAHGGLAPRFLLPEMAYRHRPGPLHL